MLRVALSGADLDHVRIASRPAPMLELRPLFLGPPLARDGLGPSEQEHIDLIAGLVTPACAPGFLFPATSDTGDAVETVAGTGRDALRRDLEDNLAAGFPVPGWTADLVRPGHGGTRARRRLHAALTYVATTFVEPRTHWAAVAVDARVRAWRSGIVGGSARSVLDSLHPGIRLRGEVLEVDLASGAEVEAVTNGAGIRIVPTLNGSPAVTVSSEGQSPLVVTCPVRPVDHPAGVNRAPDPALEDLVGRSRTMLLGAIATRPGLGTRALARRTGLSPAAVSEHLGILRRGGLVAAERAGPRLAHRLTPLGWALVRRGAFCDCR